MAWVGYLVTVGWFFLRPQRVPGTTATAPDPAAANAAVGTDRLPGAPS